MTNKKKTSRQKRTLIGAVCVAAVIMAGSTFAWFTSQDEVTNRLTASADYGVSIVEDFTPPKDMTPGQEVNKDVSIVNTGNVDALVRTQIESMLKITVPGTVDVTVTAAPSYFKADGTSSTTSGATDLVYTDYTFTLSPTLTNAVELTTTQKQNADGTMTPDEVTTLQAGGELVVEASKSVRVENQAARSGAYKTANGEYDDAGKYTPSTEGLYLFRRTYYEEDGSATVKYSGYYYKGGKYYALATEDGNKTVYVAATISETDQGTGKVVSSISGLKLKTEVTNEPSTTKNNLSYKIGYIGTESDKTKTPSDINATNVFTESTTTADQKYIQVTYNNGDNDVIFYIKLADNWSNKWQYVDDETAPTNGVAFGHFYYKDDLEAGTTSEKLIDNVTLSKEVTQNCFVDLTYDLNIVLDSVQVTYDSNGVELLPGATSVAQTAIADFGDAQATPTNGSSGSVANGEITAISWAATGT